MFSKEAVTAKVSEEFVAVALKAALVNGPPDGPEGALYAEIGRTKPAPQGICAVNPDGRVLAWALSFDGEDDILAFLDHVKDLCEAHPDASEPFPAERWMSYPGKRLGDADGIDGGPRVPKRHVDGERCPGKLGVPEGTLVGRVTGRTFRDGKPSGSTRRQERYLEARLEVSVAAQEALAEAAAAAGDDEFPLPDAFARAVLGRAFLGQLDVDPLLGGTAPEFRVNARRVIIDGDDSWLHVTGDSRLRGSDSSPDRGDGRLWSNDVRLTWDGLVRLDGRRVARLLLTARGREKLRWGNHLAELDSGSALQHLPAGRRISLDSDVRFGLEAAPAAPGDVGPSIFNGPPESLRRKVERFQKLMRDHEGEMELMRQVEPVMKKFEPALRAGKFGEAERVLDEAIGLLEE